MDMRILFHNTTPFMGAVVVGRSPFCIEDNKMNIVYAMTRNVYHKILPSLRSLAEHEPKAKVFILSEDGELPFDTPLPVTVINVSGQKQFPSGGPNYHNRFTYINLLKVCYPSILKVAKVIHLDIDTIILDSLEPLWDTDIKGKWFAAVQEYHGSYKPFGSEYYNMGVALLNLTQLRKDKAEPLMVEYLNTVSQPWADQDAWNKYGIEQDKIAELDLRYNENCMTGETNNPAIVHYCAVADWYENEQLYRREYLDRYING